MQTFLHTFGFPEFATQAWVNAAQMVGIGQTPWHLFLGTLGSEENVLDCVLNESKIQPTKGEKK
jgi:hypothetical protein